MPGVKNQDLLHDERVKQEIGRHRWIESEKAGRDIGFEQASADWLNRFSDTWIKENGGYSLWVSRLGRFVRGMFDARV